MRKISLMLAVLMVASGMTLTWNPIQAGSCAVGALVGGYLGRTLAAPTVILLSKLGVIDEDELFSPFSTLLYDAVDEGGIIGGTIGGVLVKYVFFEKPDPGKIVIDTIFSYSISKILSQFSEGWVEYYVVEPSSLGLYLGFEW